MDSQRAKLIYLFGDVNELRHSSLIDDGRSRNRVCSWSWLSGAVMNTTFGSVQPPITDRATVGHVVGLEDVRRAEGLVWFMDVDCGSGVTVALWISRMTCWRLDICEWHEVALYIAGYLAILKAST